MVGEERTNLSAPTSTLEIRKYDKLIFSVMLWEYPFCLLGRNDGVERNLHATLYDESQHIIGRIVDSPFTVVPGINSLNGIAGESSSPTSKFRCSPILVPSTTFLSIL